MVFKFNCNTFNSILCSVTPDQIDVLVSNSSLASCISYDGFLSGGFGFIMSLCKMHKVLWYYLFIYLFLTLRNCLGGDIMFVL